MCRIQDWVPIMPRHGRRCLPTFLDYVESYRYQTSSQQTNISNRVKHHQQSPFNIHTHTCPQIASSSLEYLWYTWDRLMIGCVWCGWRKKSEHDTHQKHTPTRKQVCIKLCLSLWALESTHHRKCGHASLWHFNWDRIRCYTHGKCWDEGNQKFKHNIRISSSIRHRAPNREGQAHIQVLTYPTDSNLKPLGTSM
jgi:hypothetical protein